MGAFLAAVGYCRPRQPARLARAAPLLAQPHHIQPEMDKTPTAPIAWIDAAKGLCILMVVLYHVTITSYRDFYPPAGSATAFPGIRLHEVFAMVLAPLRMPLFFMISGFLASRAATAARWPQVADKRILLFLYLYFLWSVLQWQTVTLLRNMAGEPMRSAQAIYASSWSDYAPLLLHGATDVWYLYALPLYFIGCKTLATRPGWALLAFLAAHTYGRLHVDSWPAASIFANGIYFCLGCFWGQQIFDILGTPGRMRRASLVAVLAVCAVTRTFFEDWQAIPTSLAAIALLVACLRGIQQRFPLQLLCLIGQQTLPIYVIHRILIELPDIHMQRLTADHLASSPVLAQAWLLLYPTLMGGLAVLFSLAIWRVTNRGFGRLLYALPGPLHLVPHRASLGKSQSHGS